MLIAHDDAALHVALQSIKLGGTDVVSVGLSTLANLAEDRENWSRIEGTGIIDLLIRSPDGLVSLREDAVRVECLRLIANLSVSFDLSQRFATPFVLSGLIALLTCEEPSIKRTAYLALCSKIYL